MEFTDEHLDEYANGKVEIKDLVGLEAEAMARLRGRAQFFVDGGHHERALIMLEMLEELDRTETAPTLLAIDILLELGRSDEAEAKIDVLLARAPTDADALVAKAELLIRTGQLVPAAAILRQVIEQDPDGRTDAGKRAQALAARAHAQFERQ